MFLRESSVILRILACVCNRYMKVFPYISSNLSISWEYKYTIANITTNGRTKHLFFDNLIIDIEFKFVQSIVFQEYIPVKKTKPKPSSIWVQNFDPKVGYLIYETKELACVDSVNFNI